MKKGKNYFLLILGAALMISSCKKGDMGPAGPKGDKGDTGAAGASGATGATGATGAPGTKGEHGTDNITYSNWILVDSSKWVQDGNMKVETVPHHNYNDNTDHNYLDSTIYYHVDILTPAITQEAIDKGVVYYYFKDSTGPNVGEPQLWRNYDYIPTGVTNYSYSTYFEEGRYFEVYQKSITSAKEKLVLNTAWYGSAARYDNIDGNYDYNPDRIKYQELKPKTKFYIRYVVIAGGTAGRVAKPAIDMKNYQAVKNYYKIPD